MDNEFTGQYSNSEKQPINVGDLVTLAIPRKERRNALIVFKVIKGRDGFKLIYFSGPMSDGDPNYMQELHRQVYKVVGNEKTGVDGNLLD